LNEAVKNIVFSPFDPTWREIQEKFLNPKLDLVFNGKLTAAEVLKQAAPKINAELQSNEKK